MIELETRRVSLAGLTRHPTEEWMQQMARNVTDLESGPVHPRLLLLHDRDAKFCASFRTTLTQYGVRPLMLPPRSPNLNAFAERWVRSAKEECLAKLILFSERSLRRALSEFTEHYHSERNHQGKQNLLLFPRGPSGDPSGGDIQCKRRLGGLLTYYARAA
jgi:transposase InsO family protein